MKYIMLTFLLTCLAQSQIVADHLSTRANIPDEWIEASKQLKVHYGHTSHGAQINVGLERLPYDVSIGYGNLPNTSGLNILDGTFINGSYDNTVQPIKYWDGDAGRNCTRYVLNNYDIDVSIFMWCWELRSMNEAYVDRYLNSMEQLEQEFPDVIFIYATGHSQTYEGHHYYGHLGNGYLPIFTRNHNRIRQYCMDNNKVLFDFGEIDCWWFDGNSWSQSTTNGYPREHDHYNIDQAGHTSYENCENKGKAFWWLLARLSGWQQEYTLEAPRNLRIE